MRIRTTRPEYYTSPTVGEMSWDARLVFHDLWSYVEDNGVNYDSARLFKSACMPYDGDHVIDRIEAAFDELEKLGCVIRYERDGHRLLFVPGFRKWQKVPHPGVCHFIPPEGYDHMGFTTSRESLTTSDESLTTSRAFSRSSSRSSSSGKKEEENKFSSSKENEEESSTTITADDYVASAAKQGADQQIHSEYPNLDLADSWVAFMQHHQGAVKPLSEWTRLWKGWCQRRANMSGIQPSKRHTHTWACEHTLKRLGIESRDDVQDMTKAQQTANELNKEDRNGRT